MSDKIGKVIVVGLGLAVTAASAYLAKQTSDYREKKRRKALDKEFTAIDKEIAGLMRSQDKR